MPRRDLGSPVYGLVRTAPIGDDALKYIPADAAAVAAIGLNPPTSPEGKPSSAEPPQLALMDIGRELFANVRSVSAFVVPGETDLPEIGLVVLAQDATKSKELWTRLMSLPTQFGAVPTGAVKEVEISGRAAWQYAYPDAPLIVVTQPSDESMIVGTEAAVKASLAALDEGRSLAGEGEGADLMESASPATSKALFLRGGPLLKCAQPKMSQRERRQADMIVPLLEELTASLIIDEEPNELRLKVDVAGIPHVGDVLRAVGGQSREAQRTAEHRPEDAP